MFSHKKRGKRSADPKMSPDLSSYIYMNGMTGMNLLIGRKKTERAVTRQHVPLYHDMTTGNKRPTA